MLLRAIRRKVRDDRVDRGASGSPGDTQSLDGGGRQGTVGAQHHVVGAVEMMHR
jgi:hypothetical protein